MEASSISNTKLRIISALGMLVIVAVSVSLGRGTALALIGLVGLLVVDEFIVNFLEFTRRHIGYVIAQATSWNITAKIELNNKLTCVSTKANPT